MSKRDEIIKGLRGLADYLEDTDFPMPYHVELPIFYSVLENGRLGAEVTTEDVRAAMAIAPGNWSKVYSDSYVSYRKEFSQFVSVELTLGRETICRKMQVGVRHVEATEARDVPVYDWICDDPADEPATLADHTASAIEKILGA